MAPCCFIVNPQLVGKENRDIHRTETNVANITLESPKHYSTLLALKDITSTMHEFK